MADSYKRCQSCGMPLSKDRNGGGTEADGTRSRRYCSYCYENGRFRQPEMTVNDMKHTVTGVLRRQGMAWPVVAFFAWRVTRLERWRKA